jgi:hypothetical protein
MKESTSPTGTRYFAGGEDVIDIQTGHRESQRQPLSAEASAWAAVGNIPFLTLPERNMLDVPGLLRE